MNLTLRAVFPIYAFTMVLALPLSVYSASNKDTRAKSLASKVSLELKDAVLHKVSEYVPDKKIDVDVHVNIKKVTRRDRTHSFYLSKLGVLTQHGKHDKRGKTYYVVANVNFHYVVNRQVPEMTLKSIEQISNFLAAKYDPTDVKVDFYNMRNTPLSFGEFLKEYIYVFYGMIILLLFGGVLGIVYACIMTFRMFFQNPLLAKMIEKEHVYFQKEDPEIIAKARMINEDRTDFKPGPFFEAILSLSDEVEALGPVHETKVYKSLVDKQKFKLLKALSFNCFPADIIHRIDSGTMWNLLNEFSLSERLEMIDQLPQHEQEILMNWLANENPKFHLIVKFELKRREKVGSTLQQNYWKNPNWTKLLAKLRANLRRSHSMKGLIEPLLDTWIEELYTAKDQKNAEQVA